MARWLGLAAVVTFCGLGNFVLPGTDSDPQPPRATVPLRRPIERHTDLDAISEKLSALGSRRGAPADRPASKALEETPEPVSEGEAYFRSADWMQGQQDFLAWRWSHFPPYWLPWKVREAEEVYNGTVPGTVIRDRDRWAVVTSAADGLKHAVPHQPRRFPPPARPPALPRVPRAPGRRGGSAAGGGGRAPWASRRWPPRAPRPAGAGAARPPPRGAARLQRAFRRRATACRLWRPQFGSKRGRPSWAALPRAGRGAF